MTNWLFLCHASLQEKESNTGFFTPVEQAKSRINVAQYVVPVCESVGEGGSLEMGRGPKCVSLAERRMRIEGKFVVESCGALAFRVCLQTPGFPARKD